MKLIAYPSIDQFRTVVSSINRQLSFEGLDKDGNPIYNSLKLKKTITFTGTIKLHGTNAGISFNKIDGIWAQSRENIITPEKDNAGFAFFVETNKEILRSIFDQIFIVNKLSDDLTITIFGEWVGKGIQKGVAISLLEKSFFIFGLKVSSEKEEFKNYWIDFSNIRSTENRIFNILDYKTYTIDIDFNNPRLSQNELIDMTLEVENECPVSKEFGFVGVGEGIVFTTFIDGIRHSFKSKGEKHSVSKVRTLNSVDVEKMNNIQQFVDYAVTENRFEQCIQKIFVNEEITINKISDVLRWMVTDIIKEETDTMIENNLEPKDVNKAVSNKARIMFLELLNNQ